MCTAWWALTAMQALEILALKAMSAWCRSLANGTPHLPLVLPIIETASTCSVCQGIQGYVNGTCTAAALPLSLHLDSCMLRGRQHEHSHNMQVACPAACHCHQTHCVRMPWCSADFLLLIPTELSCTDGYSKSCLGTAHHRKERHGSLQPDQTEHCDSVAHLVHARRHTPQSGAHPVAAAARLAPPLPHAAAQH